MSTIYEECDRLNLCHKCQKAKQAPDRKFCLDCLGKISIENARRYNPEKAKQYQARRRELYEEHKKNGICVRCRKKATHGIYCYEHYIGERRKSVAKAEKRRQERHEKGLVPEKRRAARECLWCRAPVIEGLQCCEKHREIFSKAGRKGYEANLKNKNNPWINEVENWKKRNNWKSSGST